jgi:hypothetical protein
MWAKEIDFSPKAATAAFGEAPSTDSVVERMLERPEG